MPPITGGFRPKSALKQSNTYERPILNQLECKSMRMEKDYEEFLESLNKHSVRYCIIGSYALAYHAKPRYTKDIDILIEASSENAKKLLNALSDFGFGSLDLSVEDFTQEGKIIQLGYEPVRIDIMTSLKDLNFSDIWRNRVQSFYGNQTVNFIDRQSFIKSKQSSKRTQDKADLELLLKEDD
jgi:predicted nucleotidyltransferase